MLHPDDDPEMLVDELTAEEIEQEILHCIEEAKNAKDPIKQQKFMEVFDGHIPTPEEFIRTIVELMRPEDHYKS